MPFERPVHAERTVATDSKGRKTAVTRLIIPPDRPAIDRSGKR
jgi:hypothetical protein